MTEAQRLDYLIKVLERDNAKAFAEKIGVSQKTVSYMRHGKRSIAIHADKVCRAYPQVKKEWLLTGRGKSGLPESKAPSDYEKELERLNKIIDNLVEENKMQRAMIEKLLKG